MENTKTPVKSQMGFTLIELMIALVVIALVIGGYVGANIMAQRNTEEMHERIVAIQDGNRAMEQIRNVSKNGVFPSDTIAAYPNNSTLPGFENLTNEEVTVSYASTTENPLDVTVTVTWLSYPVRACSETVRTYITQR